MGVEKQRGPIGAGARKFGPRIEAAFMELASAGEYAHDVQRDLWQFAVEIRSLMALGLTTSDLRWLESRGYIAHAHEVTRNEDVARSFESTHNLAFRSTTCFVLTDSGREVAEGEQAVLAMPDTSPEIRSVPLGPGADSPRLLPDWDPQHRVLRIGPRVVKRFRFSARNQEAVLTAFQEEGWPPFVYDPLPGSASQDAKQRLHDTIKYLNRNQENRLIVFRGDGKGERVLWELTFSAQRTESPRMAAVPAAA
jgi:hypothetical protein